MKKNKMMRAAAVLLVAVLLTTCAISGTFAKYVSEGSVTDTAQIASWNILLNGEAIANNIEFNLIDTIKDSDKLSDENDVATGVIAPGTSGAGVITLTNDSQVNAKFKMTFDGANAPANMTFTYTYTDDQGAELTATDGYYPIAMGETVNVTISWLWAFTNDVENDLAGTTFDVTTSFVVEQVD